jgi:hypothetical protein
MLAGSKKLHVSGDRTIDWDTVREHIEISAKGML